MGYWCGLCCFLLQSFVVRLLNILGAEVNNPLVSSVLALPTESSKG